LKCYTPLN
jgi:hypothetical protein